MKNNKEEQTSFGKNEKMIACLTPVFPRMMHFIRIGVWYSFRKEVIIPPNKYLQIEFHTYLLQNIFMPSAFTSFAHSQTEAQMENLQLHVPEHIDYIKIFSGKIYILFIFLI